MGTRTSDPPRPDTVLKNLRAPTRLAASPSAPSIRARAGVPAFLEIMLGFVRATALRRYLTGFVLVFPAILLDMLIEPLWPGTVFVLVGVGMIAAAGVGFGPALVTLGFSFLIHWVMAPQTMTGPALETVAKVVFFFCFSSLIAWIASQRWRAERELAETIHALKAERRAGVEKEKMLDAIMEYLPEGLLVVDGPKGRLRRASTYGMRFFGGAPSEVEGQTMEQFIGERQILAKDGLTQALPDELPVMRAIKKGEVLTDEELVICGPDQRLVSVLCNAGPIRNERNEITGGIVAWRDITERKRLEAELRRANSHLANVLNSIVDCYFAMDKEWTILQINSRLGALLGLTGSEVIGKKWHEVFGQPPACNCANQYERVWQEGRPGTFECLSPRVARWIEVHAYPRPDGVMEVYFRDIEERKSLEIALQHQTDELQRSNRDLEQFASIASHDLKSPLRRISNYTDLLVAQYESTLDPAAAKYLHTISESAKRLGNLVSSLLAYSRVGTSQIILREVALEAVLDQVLADHEPTIREKRAEIIRGELPAVLGSEPLLYQLLSNLVGNALKFQGPLAPRIEIRAGREGEMAVVSVKDNGIGIPPEYRDKVFNIFQRAHSQSEFEGAGIGLAVCRRIAERLKGRIWLDSDVSRGTTFYVALPGPD